MKVNRNVTNQKIVTKGDKNEKATEVEELLPQWL
jgi:hypothetical protein